VQLGRKFFNPQPAENQFVSISNDEANRMSPTFAQIVSGEAEGKTPDGHYVIDSRQWCGTVLARQHPDEETRRKVWTAANTSSADAVETLEELLLTRSKLARTVGLENWAQVALSDKMAKTPGSGDFFCDCLASGKADVVDGTLKKVSTLFSFLSPTQTRPRRLSRYRFYGN
jgi:Zn-dependent oligopeptidase